MKAALMTLAILLPLAASSNVMGGVKHIHVNINDSRVIFAAQAINAYLHDKNPKDHQKHKALKVIEATSQVVTGMLYYFKIKMSDVPNNQICTVKVWQQASMTPVIFRVGDIECNDEKNLGEDYHDDYKPYAKLLGGVTPANFSNHFVQEALRSVTDRANMASNSANRLIPSGNGTVTTKVVNGIIFRFSHVEMEVTQCMNGEKKYTIKQCPPIKDQDANMRHVSAEVFWNFKSFKLERFSFCLSSSSSNKNAHSING